MGDWIERPKLRRRERPVKPRRRSDAVRVDDWYQDGGVKAAKLGHFHGDHEVIRRLTPPEYLGELSRAP